MHEQHALCTNGKEDAQVVTDENEHNDERNKTPV
jgi:hypothetical protein